MSDFYPYTDNGGSIVAISGNSFVVIASDTRLSSGYGIYTREQPKLFILSNNSILGSTGCWCDVLTLTKLLEARIKIYQHEHQKQISTPALAQMLSVTLYYKRFFPYYVSNILVGLDNEGKGCVYNYDPIGSYERCLSRAGGNSMALLQPFLDSQVEFKNMELPITEPMTTEKSIMLIKDAFTSAAEREIYTGDGIIIYTISKDGILHDSFPLRRD